VVRQGDVMTERLSIVWQLEFDVKARAAILRDDPPAYLVEQLGRRPAAGASADLWDQAAGRIDQHCTALGIDGQSWLGHQSRPDDRVYATSHRAAVDAVKRLDRSLGRELVVDPPSRELGLSL
ncbi:MAG TPA: hypothetical protein VK988_00970, partial [Acidimicrobiales bacterium]|nr:hypothetical protein [Acidimicrobiales bacterium]